MRRGSSYTGRHAGRKKARRLPVIYIAAAAVFLFAVFRLAMGLFSDRANEKDNSALRDGAVAALASASPAPSPKRVVVSPVPSASPSPTPSPTPSPEPTPEAAPITADFNTLKKTNEDIVAWLYCADSPIDYPVVYGEDNEYYLDHNASGTKTDNGALFIDSRSEGDLTEAVTVIYGHNMETKKMFGGLDSYGKQDYYEAHPAMYLLTPEKDYRLDVVSSFYTTVDSPAFVFPCTEGSYGLLRKDIAGYSYIEALTELQEGERLVCLATCGNSDEERFLVVAALRELG